MSFPNASNIILKEIKSLEGVIILPHRFGGIEFKLVRRELGHLHGNHILDIPFPLKIKEKLIEENRVKPHHILPKSGWISFYINNEEDVKEAVKLLKLSYQLAKEKYESSKIN
jgi:Luciferase